MAALTFTHPPCYVRSMDHHHRLEVDLHVRPIRVDLHGKVELHVHGLDGLWCRHQPPHPGGVAIKFAVPTITRKGQPVANATYNLSADAVATIPVAFTFDATQAPAPMPPGDVLSVSSNTDPASLQAVMGTTASGDQAIVVNALKWPPATNPITIEVVDSVGSKAGDIDITVVAPAAQLEDIVFDTVNVTTMTQPVPGP